MAAGADNLVDVRFSVVLDDELRAFLAPLAGTDVCVAIDVPIGLAEDEGRACDRGARQRLGVPRQNSVFSAPCRGTLAAGDYLEACAINRRLRGRALSRQSWGIVRKIAAIDRLLGEIPGLAGVVWEAHPEVTFAELAGTPHGLTAGKKTADGRRQRLDLLAAHKLRLDLGGVRAHLRRPAVARDDIVDAAACLLTAQRLARGIAVFLPDGPVPYDGAGRRMQIAA